MGDAPNQSLVINEPGYRVWGYGFKGIITLVPTYPIHILYTVGGQYPHTLYPDPHVVMLTHDSRGRFVAIVITVSHALLVTVGLVREEQPLYG